MVKHILGNTQCAHYSFDNVRLLIQGKMWLTDFKHIYFYVFIAEILL